MRTKASSGLNEVSDIVEVIEDRGLVGSNVVADVVVVGTIESKLDHVLRRVKSLDFLFVRNAALDVESSRAPGVEVLAVQVKVGHRHLRRVEVLTKSLFANSSQQGVERDPVAVNFRLGITTLSLSMIVATARAISASPMWRM